jgi:hypothetical protein
MILPLFTSTAPTIGFGEVAPKPRLASCKAWLINFVSLFTEVISKLIFVVAGIYSIRRSKKYSL